MVDTIGFFYEPDKFDRKEIKRTFKPHKGGEFTWYINSLNNEIKMTYKPKYNYIFIRVNSKKLLNKSTIVNDDYFPLVEKINIYLKRYFSKIRFQNLELSRIDYKKDITSYKDIYIQILKKLNNTYRRKNKTVYDTSVYYRGKSYNLNLYDKEAESKNIIEYKDTLRLEIQIKRPYLKSILSKHGLEITLENFFDNNIKFLFFKEILYPLFYVGDYYTIEESRKILNKFYSENMTGKLIDLQKLIYKWGISKARKKINNSTWYRYLKLLNSAKVNPILFKKFDGIKKLPNLICYLKE